MSGRLTCRAVYEVKEILNTGKGGQTGGKHYTPCKISPRDPCKTFTSDSTSILKSVRPAWHNWSARETFRHTVCYLKVVSSSLTAGASSRSQRHYFCVFAEEGLMVVLGKRCDVEKKAGKRRGRAALFNAYTRGKCGKGERIDRRIGRDMRGWWTAGTPRATRNAIASRIHKFHSRCDRLRPSASRACSPTSTAARSG